MSYVFLPLFIVSFIPVLHDIKADRLGFCDAGNTHYDLHHLLYLENRTLDFAENNSAYNVTLVGEDILIRPLIASQGTYIANIGYAADPKSDLDVSTKFAYFDGKLTVYWRETFEHRVYRQGLFSVTGKGLRTLCEGKGGLTTR